MTNPLHDTESPRSRRSLFKWLGQVAAGAAVAGIGLAAGAGNAFAAHPNFVSCPTCTITKCEFDQGCSDATHGQRTIDFIYDRLNPGREPNCTVQERNIGSCVATTADCFC